MSPYGAVVRLQRFRDMLSVLTPTQLSVVALRLDGASVVDIAEMLGISHQAVVERLNNAGRRLVRHWPELEDEAESRRRDRNKRSAYQVLSPDALRVFLAVKESVARGEPAYRNALARRLGMDSRRVGHFLHQLVDRGHLVRNGRNGPDGRQRTYTLPATVSSYRTPN